MEVLHMKLRLFGLLFVFIPVFLASTALATSQVHWDYTEGGPEGPANWGHLAPEYEFCVKGKNQSPVNLDNMIESDLPFIKFNYEVGGNEVVNNGHTVQVNYAAGSTITVNGKTFELKQFHFHSPSENTIRGEYFPLEAHFVHADSNGNLAVVAVMYRTGMEQQELEKAWAQMPQTAGESVPLSENVDANKLLPPDKDYYGFNGSLTTPPCSEGVLWMVIKDAGQVSLEQVTKFTETMHHPNNRPVQPVNARIIMQ